MRIRKYYGFIIFLAIVWIPAVAYVSTAEPRVKPADLVLMNGKIITVDEEQPEVEALAVRQGKIAAVGTSEEIRKYIGESTQVINIKGLCAVPGFIDGHGHLLMLGQSQKKLDLTSTRNWEEIVSIVQEKVQKVQTGEWIFGYGWHQEKWDKIPTSNIEGYPTDDALNKISPDNPVVLVHASGHALIANNKARKLAGVTKATEVPDGGRILRDARGNPRGVFFDGAMHLITKAYALNLGKRTPEQAEAQARESMELAVKECLSKGITSFQDASSSFQEIDLFKKLVDENNLGIRLWVMIRASNEAIVKNAGHYKSIGYGDNRLTVRAIKKFMDGAMGSRTAWLLKPYSDLPESTGINVESPQEILETARFAIKNGFQLCVHAIGDRANRETLDIYQTVFRETADSKNLRWRIEHAQHLDPMDIPRFNKLGVIASMQAIHCTSDGPWITRRLGAQRTLEGAYVWQKLLRTGALVTNGTDAPIEAVNPIANFYASVTRKMPNGEAFYPDQRMSRLQALKAYTINNAFAAFEENIKGSLSCGKLADITVLSGDPMTVPEDEILAIQVLYTIVGGKVMYRK